MEFVLNDEQQALRDMLADVRREGGPPEGGELGRSAEFPPGNGRKTRRARSPRGDGPRGYGGSGWTC